MSRRFACSVTFVIFIAFAAPACAQYSATVLPLPVGAASGQVLAVTNGQFVGTTTSPVGSGLIWNGDSGAINVKNGGWGSTVEAIQGAFQGGSFVATTVTVGGSGRGGHSTTYYIPHAALWHGSAGTLVDLNPAGAYRSAVTGLSNGREVGWQAASLYASPHATVWTGSASSAKIIDPVGDSSAEALATSGAEIVGYGQLASGGIHALLWSGPNLKAMDLEPTNIPNAGSVAAAVDSATNEQAGYIYVTGSSYPQACLWHGTAKSVVNLDPFGTAYGSAALAVRNGLQAGYAVVTYGWPHAMVWRGSSASAVDLHAFLPSSYIRSEATGIDADGTVVGWAFDGSVYSPVVWRPSAEVTVGMTQDLEPATSGWTTATTKLTVTSPFGAGSSIYFAINGSAFQEVSKASTTLTFTHSASYLVTAYATSGSNSTPPRDYTLNLDDSPPVTTESLSNFTLTLTGMDPASGIAGTYYQLDGGPTLVYTAPVPLENIPHSLKYWSVDNAGNVESAHSSLLSSAAPVLTSISPSVVLSGGAGLTLALSGHGFVASSIVTWNGVALSTSYADANSLAANVPATALANVGTITVRVTNQAPSSGTSAGATITILQRASASGSVTVEDGVEGPFTMRPVTSSSGFSFSGHSLSVVPTTSTVYFGSSGGKISEATFFSALNNGAIVSVAGTWDATSQTLTPWTASLN